MGKKAFECKSCGVLVFIKSSESETPWCPICRGGTVEIEIGEHGELIEYRCSECQYCFSLEEGQNPYKCPICNFTFPTTPGRRHEERL